MLSKIKTGGFLAALLISTAVSATTISTPITSVVSFGDSLSDNGNLFHLKEGKELNLPYYYGRCTNGLVWVEILTASLNLSPNQLDDRAIAGAQTHDGYPINDDNPPSPGVLSQVNQYVDANPILDPNRLYVIWAGGDNYIFHPYFGSPAAQHIAVQRALDDLHSAIADLAAHGARYFLVPNLPDVGVIPLARQLQADKPKLHLQENLTSMSVEHNKRLALDLPVWASKLNITIIPVDVYHMMQQAIESPLKFGFVNVTTPCYKGTYVGGGASCTKPDKYLFWDGVHPTFAGHQIVADLALKALEKNNLVQLDVSSKE